MPLAHAPSHGYSAYRAFLPSHLPDVLDFIVVANPSSRVPLSVLLHPLGVSRCTVKSFTHEPESVFLLTSNVRFAAPSIRWNGDDVFHSRSGADNRIFVLCVPRFDRWWTRWCARTLVRLGMVDTPFSSSSG